MTLEDTMATVAALKTRGDAKMATKKSEVTTEVGYGGLCSVCLEVVCECPPVKKTNKPRSAPSSTVDVAGKVGRGGTGRLRNFKAMNDAKLEKVYSDIFSEGMVQKTPDHEALEACGQVMIDRGLMDHDDLVADSRRFAEV